MPELPFHWVDVFTNKQFSGNPCAVILGGDSLSSETMQTIAKEMNLSETAFVRSPQGGRFGARYFTPNEELPFAGHPTLAAAHVLAQAGWIRSPVQQAEILLELPAGVIQSIRVEGEVVTPVVGQIDVPARAHP